MAVQISLSPNYWSFGNKAINSITDKTSTISSVGDATLIIGAMTGLSSPYSLQTDLSGTSIGPGGGSDFVVRYDPTAIGSTHQTLDITSNAANFPVYHFGVDGTSQAAVISASPTYISYGNKVKDSTTSQVLRVTNNGNVNLILGTIGSMITPFWSSGTWFSDQTITPGNYFDGTIQYKPTALSTGSSDYIDLTSNDPVTPTLRINVDGTCQEADIAVSPSFKSFGIKGKDSTTSQVFRVTNNGNINLVLGTVGSMVIPFWSSGTWFSGQTITPGNHFDGTVLYKPTALSTGSNDYFDLTSNDPNVPTLRVTVDGTCQQVVIGVSPTYYSFGNKAETTTTDRTVTVTNNGNIPMVMGTLSGLADPFTMVNNNVSGKTLTSNGDASTVVVRYHPMSFGTFTDTLVIPSNDPVTPSFSLGVDGTSSGASNIDVSPAGFSFGTVPCGFIADILITVSNTGDQALTMSGVTGLGGPFSVIEDHVSNQTIEVSGSRTLSIRFLPRSKNTYTGTLYINSNDPDTPSYPVTVTGNSNATFNHGDGRRSAVNGQLSDYAA